MALKQEEINTLCGDGGALNDKLAFALSKYIFKAFDLISQNDKQLISTIQNGQQFLTIQLKMREKLGNSCILKAQFENHSVL